MSKVAFNKHFISTGADVRPGSGAYGCHVAGLKLSDTRFLFAWTSSDGESDVGPFTSMWAIRDEKNRPIASGQLANTIVQSAEVGGTSVGLMKIGYNRLTREICFIWRRQHVKATDVYFLLSDGMTHPQPFIAQSGSISEDLSSIALNTADFIGLVKYEGYLPPSGSDYGYPVSDLGFLGDVDIAYLDPGLWVAMLGMTGQSNWAMHVVSNPEYLNISDERRGEFFSWWSVGAGGVSGMVSSGQTISRVDGPILGHKTFYGGYLHVATAFGDGALIGDHLGDIAGTYGGKMFRTIDGKVLAVCSVPGLRMTPDNIASIQTQEDGTDPILIGALDYTYRPCGNGIFIVDVNSALGLSSHVFQQGPGVYFRPIGYQIGDDFGVVRQDQSPGVYKIIDADGYGVDAYQDIQGGLFDGTGDTWIITLTSEGKWIRVDPPSEDQLEWVSEDVHTSISANIFGDMWPFSKKSMFAWIQDVTIDSVAYEGNICLFPLSRMPNLRQTQRDDVVRRVSGGGNNPTSVQSSRIRRRGPNAYL